MSSKNKKYLSESEIREILNEFPYKSNKELAKKYSRSTSTIERVASKNNIKKDKKYLEKVKKEILTKRNKELGRDLTYEFVKTQAKKYQTRGEFQYKDSSAYQAARRAGYIDEICSHMYVPNFSIPEVILKQITESLYNTESIHNDREFIKPYEIDIFFPQINMAFEYDGKGWHQDDIIDKEKMCNEKGVTLITISERSRRYEEDIKNQLVENIAKINKNINYTVYVEDVIEFKEKIIFPKIFSDEELKICRSLNKKQLRDTDIRLYNKYYKYNPDNKIFTNTKWNRETIIKEIAKYTKKLDFINNSKGVYLAMFKRYKDIKKEYYDKLESSVR